MSKNKASLKEKIATWSEGRSRFVFRFESSIGFASSIAPFLHLLETREIKTGTYDLEQQRWQFEDDQWLTVAVDNAEKDRHGNRLEVVTSDWYWAVAPVPAPSWTIVAVNQQGCFALQYQYDSDLHHKDSATIKEECCKNMVRSGEISAITIPENYQTFYFTQLSPQEFSQKLQDFAANWLLPISS